MKQNKGFSSQPRHQRIDKKRKIDLLQPWINLSLSIFTIIAIGVSYKQACESKQANEIAQKSLEHIIEKDSKDSIYQVIRDSVQKAIYDSTIASLKRQAEAAYISAYSNKASVELANKSLSTQIKQFKLINEPYIVFDKVTANIEINKEIFFDVIYRNIGKIPATMLTNHIATVFVPNNEKSLELIKQHFANLPTEYNQENYVGIISGERPYNFVMKTTMKIDRNLFELIKLDLFSMYTSFKISYMSGGKLKFLSTIVKPSFFIQNDSVMSIDTYKVIE